MKKLRVLIACEFSGVVREAFKARGHDAWSCDLLPTEIPGQHIQGDVFEILNDGWDMMIAHPVCTYLCNSGVRWLYSEPGRWEKMVRAAIEFDKFWNADIEKVVVENPVPHKYARLPPYTQIIQPHQFGHPETKMTCLWERGVGKLEPTKEVSGREHRIHRMAPGPNRSKERSRTFPGIADAFAAQWG